MTVIKDIFSDHLNAENGDDLSYDILVVNKFIQNIEVTVGYDTLVLTF
jgi:hypothetical protein